MCVESPSEESTLISKSEETSLLGDINRARRLLYISHTVAEFSECTWQFALILFLAAFSNYKSLVLVSTYGLATGLSVFIWGTTAGRFVDSRNRLVVARAFVWSQNLCVILASVLCYTLLSGSPVEESPQSAFPIEDETYSMWWESHLAGIRSNSSSLWALVGIHVFGSLAAILDKGSTVAIERDWIVVMSENVPTCHQNQASLRDYTLRERETESKAWLSATNVNMKQIDLSCRLAAPAVAGFLIAAFDSNSEATSGDMDSKDLAGAAILIFMLTSISLVVESLCMEKIYRMVPALASPKLGHRIGESESGCRLMALTSGLRLYLKQSISPGGIGLALLYLNVLTFGALMTAYLVWRGMRLETVGILRGISSAIGLAGTFVYHASVKRTSLVNTGMWSVLYEVLCLTVSFGSLFIEDYNLSMTLLIGGVCASRIGLWVFDIAITQLQQEFVPQTIRGSIGGTQASLNALFQLLSFALGLVFPDPKQFHIYVSAGYAAVAVAGGLFYAGIYRKKSDFTVSND